MANTYDFYKPKLDSEYPEVDGPLSITTYVTALDQSYARFREKTARALAIQSKLKGIANGHSNGNGHAHTHSNGNGHSHSLSNGSSTKPSAFSLESIDYPIFHSPYGKLVQKGHARLLFNDFLSSPTSPKFSTLPQSTRDSLLALPYTQTLSDKTLEKTFVSFASPSYKEHVAPSMHCAKRCGNMYTASLYGGLASVVSAVEPSALKGKRLSMFAYGSGCAASFYTIRVKGDTSEIQEKMDLLNRLASMKVVPCQEYVDSLAVSIYSLCFLIVNGGLC